MSLRHAILGVLEYEPHHGYALKCVLERGISSFWPVNLAAIYPNLRKLEEEGLVTHRNEPTPTGRPDRKVYSVTDAGREELSRWRRIPPDDPTPRFRNQLFLKLLFARRENLSDVREWVSHARNDALASAERLGKALRDEPDQRLFVEFLRECGLAHLEVHAKLLSDLEQRLERIVEDDAEATGADLAQRELEGMEVF